MEPLNYHALLIFLLITFNSANATCVPINGTKTTTSPINGTKTTTSPINGTKPTTSPINGTKPTTSPINGTKPTTSPINGTKPTTSPINGTKPTTSPSPSLSPHASPISQPVASPKPVPSHQPPSNPKPKSIFPILPNLMKGVPQSVHADPAIQKICAATDYPEDCVSSIAPLCRGKTDLMSIVELAIKAATAHTQVAIAVATKLAASHGIAADVASIISDCKDSYDDALDNFHKALEALSLRDVGTMNSMLSAAITDFSDNADFLAGKDCSPSLVEFNAKLTKMTSNCLAIVSLIK